jgi:hypothetical protein
MTCKHKALFRSYVPIREKIVPLKSYAYLCDCGCGCLEREPLQAKDLYYHQLSKESKEEADKKQWDKCNCEEGKEKNA